MMTQIVIVPFLLAIIWSVAITIIVRRIYVGLGWVDKSTKKDHLKNIHDKPVPRGGGIPVFIAMLGTALFLIEINTALASIFFGAAILMVLGILDDIFNISPYIRLLLGFVVAFIVVYVGQVSIGYISSPLGGIMNIPYFLDVTISVLWIVWAMNFVNMGAKGLDGQLPGVTIVASIVMGLLSLKFGGDASSWPSTSMAFALAGAYAGLLIFNAYPQSIMPGWGAGVLAGYFLAAISMLSSTKVATALIVLGVPLMDVIYSISRRIIAGKSPVWGDNKHLHHKLLQIGLSKRQVAYLYWGVTAILGLIALQLDSRAKVYIIVMLAVFFGGVLLWINLLLSQKQRE